MKKSAAAVDDRQGVIPIDLPPGPRLSSDEKARGELLDMVERLRQRRRNRGALDCSGWQQRRLDALKQLSGRLTRRL